MKEAHKKTLKIACKNCISCEFLEKDEKLCFCKYLEKYAELEDYCEDFSSRNWEAAKER